jgi:heat-inducible transcriptional repressor
MFMIGDRADHVLSHIVHVFLETRLPVPSHRIAGIMGLSPATMRSVMADLEKQGFLSSAHSSSGRMPTEKTWRLYSQSLVNQCSTQTLSDGDWAALRALEYSDSTMVSQTLADLCQGAGIFFAAPPDLIISSIKFLRLSASKSLIALEMMCGKTEYRVISIPAHITAEQLTEVSDFLNQLVHQRSISDALSHVEKTLGQTSEYLFLLSMHLLRNGVGDLEGRLDIKGHSYLLDAVCDSDSASAFKMLLTWVEKQQLMFSMLHQVILKRQLQVFFGHDDGFANIQGCSVVVAPYQCRENKGVVGIIGPLHMDYRRVIPIINGMAKIVEKTFK